MKKSISKIAAIFMATALTVTACGPAAGPTTTTPGSGGGTTTAGDTTATGEEIKLGLFEPLTGANAGGGELEAMGMRLANKVYPSVLGRPIKLIEADNKSDRVEAANAANSLVNAGVSAVLGSWGSTLSIGGGSAFETAQIPAVAASATNPQVTEGNEYYYRVCFIDPFQGQVMANYAYTNLNFTKAAIIREINSDYSVGLANFFQEKFTELGGTISATYDFQTGDQDYNAQLTNLKATDAEVIFLPANFTEAGLIVKQARELGIELPVLGGDTWETPQLIEIGGSAVEGTVFSTFYDESQVLTPETSKFIEEWKKEYPNDDAAAVSALAYDAYLIVYKAIEAAGSSEPAKIKEALDNMVDFEGATGIVNFDENRNAIKDAVLKTIENGEFKFVDTVGAGD